MRRPIWLLFSLLLVSACATKPNFKTLHLDLNTEYQTIHSFGASDAWRVQFVGSQWPQDKKEKMAEWLFSKEFNKQGDPLGIGLSLWRFNLGAGSMDQGTNSNINHPWRKAESFLNPDGTFNWEKQKGQQWFLHKAKQYGVEHRLAFVNSPPVYYTLNGQAYSAPNRTEINLQSEKMEAYARYLAEICTHFEEIGLGFDYLSPANEPQWDWSKPSQEGTPATNANLYQLTYLLNKELQERQLPVKLTVPEAAEYNFLYQFEEKYPGVSNQFKNFWEKDAPFFLGHMDQVAPVFAAHGYFTTWPVEKLIKSRQAVGKTITNSSQAVDFWQSEFCILEDNDDIGGGHGRDLEMPTALYVARVIHFDLVLAQASSWQWWTALSQVDYKDGLIYLDKGNNGITDHNDPENEALKSDGNFHDSKLLWGLGNYSRFVRPGMVRIKSVTEKREDPFKAASDLMISAYKNEQNKEVVVVAVNYSETNYALQLNSSTDFLAEVKTYTTSKDYNLAYQPANINQLEVPAQSIKTFVLQY